ncbi:MAG: PAS domain-containing protein [Gemmatimonadaceae bacterium]|nr:PAS domain-containing protein [Gemmatimonadaceae bacterium]
MTMVPLALLLPETAGRRLSALAVLLVVAAVVVAVARSGRVALASWLLIAGLLALVTERAWFNGGLYSVMPAYLIVFVLMGSVLLQRRGAIAAAAAGAVIAGVFALGHLSGWILPASGSEPPLAVLIQTLLVIGVSLLLQGMAAAAFQGALNRAESEIRERAATQARLDLALELGEIGIWTYDLATGQFHVDERTLRARGIAGTERRSFDRAEWRSWIHPEDRDQSWAEFELTLRHGAPLHIALRTLGADGATRHIVSSATPIRNAAGDITQILGISVDVTDRTVAELERARLVHDLGERVKALRLLHATAVTSQRAWSDTRELLGHVVALMPAAWQYPECTEARIVLGEVEVATPGWRETAWMQSAPLTAIGRSGSVAVAYTEQKPDADEGPFLREERDLLASLVEMLSAVLESRQTQQLLEEQVDKRTEELHQARQRLAEQLHQLQDLERLRDDLSKMIVHDLRGFLTVIIANLEMAQAESGDGPDGVVMDALGAAQAVNRMANTILDVSRLESGQMPINRTPTELCELARETARTFAVMDRSRSIRCESTVRVTVDCDADLVRRVLENLVSNALKHTPAGGTITLDVREDADGVAVSVRDEGDGIPDDLRPRLFEKYATGRHDPRYHSSGLGLAFCKLAVEGHGGTIAVAPAEGRGSVFTFTLPRAPQQSAPRALARSR